MEEVMHLLSMFIRAIYISSIICIYFSFKKNALKHLFTFFFLTIILFIYIISYFYFTKSFLFHIKALTNCPSVFWLVILFLNIFIFYLCKIFYSSKDFDGCRLCCKIFKRVHFSAYACMFLYCWLPPIFKIRCLSWH